MGRQVHRPRYAVKAAPAAKPAPAAVEPKRPPPSEAAPAKTGGSNRNAPREPAPAWRARDTKAPSEPAAAAKTGCSAKNAPSEAAAETGSARTGSNEAAAKTVCTPEASPRSEEALKTSSCAEPPHAPSEAELSTTATTATDEGDNEGGDTSTTKEVEVEAECVDEGVDAYEYGGWPEGMGYLSNFDLGMATTCSLAVPGVPGFNEQGIPGVYIPTVCFDQASSFFLHPGLVFDEDPALQGLSEEENIAAASQQTELLLEALMSDRPGHDRHGRREKKGAASLQELEALEKWAALGSGSAAWQTPEQEAADEKADAPKEEVREATADTRGEAEAEEGKAAVEEAIAAPQACDSTTGSAEVPEVQVRESPALPADVPEIQACDVLPSLPVAVPESQACEILPSLPVAVPESQVAAYLAPSFRERERRGGAFSEGRRQGRKGREARMHEELGRSSGSGLCWAAQSIHFTTVMLRNIPNKYTRDMLVNQLNQHLRGKFDFIYLPMDFKNACNVGYGFINFRSYEACRVFVSKFSGVEVSRCLPGINNSNKVAEVTPARVQGFEENVKRLRISPVMQELILHPEWMPLVFDEKGVQSPLPLPDGPATSFRRVPGGGAEAAQGLQRPRKQGKGGK